jgi:hypothetical protein
VLDFTWLADANAMQTLGLDADGRVYFGVATNWA